MDLTTVTKPACRPRQCDPTVLRFAEGRGLLSVHLTSELVINRTLTFSMGAVAVLLMAPAKRQLLSPGRAAGIQGMACIGMQETHLRELLQ